MKSTNSKTDVNSNPSGRNSPEVPTARDSVHESVRGICLHHTAMERWNLGCPVCLRRENQRLSETIGRLAALLRQSAKGAGWPSPLEIDAALNRASDISANDQEHLTPRK